LKITAHRFLPETKSTTNPHTIHITIKTKTAHATNEKTSEQTSAIKRAMALSSFQLPHKIPTRHHLEPILKLNQGHERFETT
jgi:hypothetical protein